MRKTAEFFLEMFKLSLFVVGGGYAIIAVADDVCAKKKWTEEGELYDSLPVFQMIPGLIATHAAVYVGRKIAGAAGAVAGVIAVALPSVAIFTAVSVSYGAFPVDSPVLTSAFAGLRSALVGIISATLVRGWKRSVPDVFAATVMLSSLAALFSGVPVSLVVLAAVFAGVAETYFFPKGASKRFFRSSFLPLAVFLKYGALCFGGGFVLVPMYFEDFVGPGAPYLNIPESAFADLMSLTQMTPGPIGVNAATFFGYTLAGVPGAVIASAALLLPGSLLAYFAFASLERLRENRFVRGVMRGARPSSAALMLFALFVFSGTCLWSSDEGLDFVSVVIAAVSALVVMKKKINMILLSVVAAIAAAVLKAEPVTAEKYPDADIVALEETERVAYAPDGTYESVSESRVKILTERGRRTKSSLSLYYSKRYGEAAIEYVGITGADGKERAVDVSSSMKESTDNSSMDANIYDPLDRVIKCNVPGLRVGDVLRVRSRRKALKPRCKDAWSDFSVMEWTYPVLKSVYEVKSPKERPLAKIAVRNPLGNVRKSEKTLPDGSVLHTFVAENSPRCFPEADMPPLYTQVQSVRVSTVGSWQELSRWYWKLCEGHMAKTNAAMAAFVSAAAAECSGRDLMRRIFRFVSQEIRYMGLTMEDTSPGYEPHDVDITFDNRYGVCRDKAVLLAAMLRLAGFKAFPVLIHAGAKMDPEVPQPFFNHAIAAVEEKPGAGYILMDPTDESTVDMFPSYLGDKSYLVARSEGDVLRLAPVQPPSHNSLFIDSDCSVSSDGSLFLESRVSCRGINDIAYRHALVRRTREERINLFTRILRSVFPGAEVLRCAFASDDMSDTEKPLDFNLAVRIPGGVIKGKTGEELTLPFLGEKLGLANFLFRDNMSLEKRKYPLVLTSTAGISEKVRITLDEKSGEWLSPEKRLESSVDGVYSLVRTLSLTGGVMTATRDIEVSAVELSPGQYGALRSALEKSESFGRRRPVFAFDREAGADTRTILSSSATSVFSDREWVTTNVFVRKILSYAGKKESAELSFSYNPAVERIDVTHACVSNVDGRVTAVSAREKNEMDASWAAQSPRYPASKTLVVNLPSVEIGSVVSWTVVHAVTNSPVPFRSTYLFDSFDPLDRRVVRVDGWTRDEKNARRLVKEPSLPDARLWRDRETVVKGGFDSVRRDLETAVDVESLPPTDLPGIEGDDVLSIRNWMAKNVRVTGPSMWEIPLERHQTPPQDVIRERYASRFDYIRTLVSLLRGAGHDADIVIAADNASDEKSLRVLDKTEEPSVGSFRYALCRVREGRSFFPWFSGEEKTFFIGTENEYAPLGPTAYAGCDYYDPRDGVFGVVTPVDPSFEDETREKRRYDVREDGSVEVTVSSEIYGSAVSLFRRRYKEILPEDLRRHHAELLCSVSQAAEAVGDLEFDTEGYPAKRVFKCRVPGFAVVSGDLMKIELPPMPCSVPSLEGLSRVSPVQADACDKSISETVVRFPPGYVIEECVPRPFSFASPDDASGWMRQEVSTRVLDGRLVVSVVRTLDARESRVYPASTAPLFFGWRAISSSRASRTVTARRKGSAE